MRSQGQCGELETDLIVALARSAVSHGLRALGQSNFHQFPGDKGPGDGRAQQIAALVHGIGPEHGEDVVGYEFFPQIHHKSLAGPGVQGFFLQTVQFLALPQIGGHGDDLAIVIFPDPLQDGGSVQAAGIGQYDFFYLAHGMLLSANSAGKFMVMGPARNAPQVL